MRKVFVIALLLALSGCGVPENDFARLMRQEAIDDAKQTGPEPLSCGKDDDLSSGFTGVKNGQPVRGVICGGIGGGFGKAYTIRYR